MAATTEAKTKQSSYFATEDINRYTLDDGESFIEHIKLDEGLFQQYQDITSKIKLDREGEHTEVDMALGKQRKFLLENLVTGWNLVDANGKPIKFTHSQLLKLPPHVISGLIQDIHESNPILGGRDDEDEDSEGKNN